MPNYKVFQDLPSELRSRIYGLDGLTDVALLVDASGAVAIQPLTNASSSVLIYGNDGTDNVAVLVDASGAVAIQPLTNASSSVLIYGNDGTGNVVILTDASGAVAIQDNGGSITVDATNLGIRDLTNASDSVLIYGNDGTGNVVILTDASGVLQVSSSLSFVEATQTVGTATAYVGSTAEDVSTHPNYTWFIQNTDPTNTATVKLEISPNSTDWLLDGTSYVVGTSTAITLEPNVFLKWTRVSYQSTTAGADATLVLIWQAYS